MSRFRTFMEKTIHLQLQHLTHMRTPAPVLIAFVAFTGLSIVRHGPSGSISALTSTLGRALVKSRSGRIPILSSFFNMLVRALTSACLRVRIHVKLSLRWWQMLHQSDGRSRDYDTYPTPRAEARYWRVAERYRRRLYSGDSNTLAIAPSSRRTERSGEIVSAVPYYTPRLLPLYRVHHRGKRSSDVDTDAQECWISPKTFCKWHRMVFEGSRHPTLAQATKQMKYYSNRDLREMQRIARLVPDEQIFRSRAPGKVKWAAKYSDMWKSWLERKGVDLVIVFE
ncbi:hypothetical protein PAXRUDRAFT_833068 [Paxillus rubicundulus Ve08.2h10]|uniref:Unplaced genomic scaffold scaffold_1039, whole genome shotgun sequence n=1 Tax=Paxillus rubicundulus Ve08.2h10 TaxID=930991 RepID=A0A0D0DAV8_9AGAM|nr:hypothetical protein PAXRUDRAFT_833068 [Paxillus rubicundulus Ve08.2h10]